MSRCSRDVIAAPAPIEAEPETKVVVSCDEFLEIVELAPAVIEECVAANYGLKPRERLLLAASRSVGVLDGESRRIIEEGVERIQRKGRLDSLSRGRHRP